MAGITRCVALILSFWYCMTLIVGCCKYRLGARIHSNEAVSLPCFVFVCLRFRLIFFF